MNQKLISGLTATLLISTFGTTLPSNANQPEAVDPGSETNLQSEANLQAASNQLSPAVSLSTEVVKVGESRSATSADGEMVAKVHAHQLAGRQAATLYVRNIPVLTITSASKTASEGVKMGTQLTEASQPGAAITAAKSLSASDTPAMAAQGQPSSLTAIAAEATAPSETDPVWRAASIAAKLNQLNRDGMDAQAITVSFAAPTSEAASDRYTIKLKDSVIAVMDGTTLLPDTTNSLEEDALQATNRLRRLLGNAAPLNNISGKPNRSSQQISLGPIRFRLNGLASWYGPGFHGNQSASGEVFNQNAMTAAHRSLPFGTRVLVTNLDNGQSVVVRINDRGPYSGNRIIDLSAAAARVLGVMQTGVAPVRLDLVQQTVAGN